jgi:hypothetical protein
MIRELRDTKHDKYFEYNTCFIYDNTQKDVMICFNANEPEILKLLL